MARSIEETLNRLSESDFRASFHLTKKEKEYVKEKGMDVIERHTRDFIDNKIGAAYPVNDGKQTPTSGHPVFKAMHGCACCCRGCLNKWYKVPLHTELTEEKQKRIVNLLLAWIEKEYDKK